MNKKITVTLPALPPLEEFLPYLEQIWESRWLTNNGPFHELLESKLAEYLGVDHISLFSNGTLALICALRALDIQGEVITTPYSFVATTHALWWNNITPVFVDIEPEYLNLDPDKIESAITERTSAILPVHVYGNPCKMELIEAIAGKHHLKVIYDAAHAFGVKIRDRSILDLGDLSVLSFHATKVFTTLEGGAIVSHSAEMKHHIDNLRNFGFQDETVVEEPGINAKMNEMQSAFGLLQLKYVDLYIAERKRITNIYRKLLRDISGLQFLYDMEGVHHNYAYFPILIDENFFGMSRDELYLKLQQNNIYSRRYFYPLICDLTMYNSLVSAASTNMPVAIRLAKQVICLPIYPDLELEIVKEIAELIKNYQR